MASTTQAWAYSQADWAYCSDRQKWPNQRCYRHQIRGIGDPPRWTPTRWQTSEWDPKAERYTDWTTINPADVPPEAHTAMRQLLERRTRQQPDQPT